MSEKILDNKCVVLGVTGGIAAYKSATLASRLVKEGAEVHVIMSANAVNFITPVTFETLTGNKCYIDTFDRNFRFDVTHISLAKKADLIMVAPATANFIAKAANGIADDMLTTVLLAAGCPKLVAPAMNTGMFLNPITQDNIEKLKHYGFTVIEPASGRLACGDTGAGKMPEPEELIKYIMKEISFSKDLKGLKVLVTAGPTREEIDPVRFITNHSSGKMGQAIARAAMLRGAEVTLISGPVNLPPVEFVETVNITSAEDLYRQMMERAGDFDLLFMSAAVADFTPAVKSDHKVKKNEVFSAEKPAAYKTERTGNAENDETVNGGRTWSLPLVQTRDILGELSKVRKDGQVLCGFAMETDNLLENAGRKLKTKKLDMIAANSLRTAGAGFAGDTNVVTVITENGTRELGMLSKLETGMKLLDQAADIYRKKNS